MKTKYDALEELATKAYEYGGAIGEFSWYGVGELRDMGRIGASGASRVGAADDAYIAAANPSAVLGLIADVKALAAALRKIEQGTTSDWVATEALAALERIQEQS